MDKTKLKEQLQQAINNKKTVSFEYSGCARIVQPQEFLSEGEQILVLQTGGDTTRGAIETPSLKRFYLDKITNFKAA